MNRRLVILRAVDDSAVVNDALRLALEHAVAELGGVGGMVHSRRLSWQQGLNLVVSSGLPDAITRHWAEVVDDGASALVPSRAPQAPVWVPGVGAAAPESGLPGGTAAEQAGGLARTWASNPPTAAVGTAGAASIPWQVGASWPSRCPGPMAQ